MPQSLLSISHDAEGIFRSRPNRFLGIVEVKTNKNSEPSIEKVHIHDPGRLNELLYPGNHVLLKHVTSTNRKTSWDLLAARVNKQWVFTHSGYHRIITENILNNKTISPFGKISEIRPEVTVGHSRLDFLITKPEDVKIYVEVKGCTLTRNGTALFPDAPTIRGSRHLETLISIRETGTHSAIILLIFRTDSQCFAPNTNTDPKFSKTFKKAKEKGVELYPIVLEYDGKNICYLKTIPLCPNL
ncbi:DNA/RNA nuclease SfsA [[Eubacterium] cellulosolvens]